MQFIDQGQPRITHIDGTRVTAGGNTSASPRYTYASNTYNSNEVIKKEEKILEQYDSIPELIKKVAILKKYAIKEKLDVVKVLDAFMTKKELIIYRTREEIKKLALAILKERKEATTKAKRDLDNYVVPYGHQRGTSADNIGIYLSSNTNHKKLHLTQ